MTLINLTATADGLRAVISVDGVVEGGRADQLGLRTTKLWTLPHHRAILAASGAVAAAVEFACGLLVTGPAHDADELFAAFPGLLREVATRNAGAELRVFAATWAVDRVRAAIFCHTADFAPVAVEGTTAGQPRLLGRYAAITAAFARAAEGHGVEDFHRATLAAQTAEIRQGRHGLDRQAGGPYTIASIDRAGISMRVLDEAELLASASRAA